MKGDWKQEVKDMSFERYDKLQKVGKVSLVFEDEGNIVLARTTGYKEDSVVFVVTVGGQKKELWMSKLHPVLRELAEKGKLTGHKCTLSFEGKGLDMRIKVDNFN